MNITYQDFDYRSVLVKRYRNYHLSELDVMVFFVSDDVIRIQKDVVLSCDILSDYMSAPKKDIDQSLSRLIKNHIIESVAENGGLFFSTEGFKKKLFDDVIHDLVLEKSIGKTKDGLNTSLSDAVEEIIGRSLSPIERNHISNWLKEGADDGMIKEAVRKSITKSGYLSMKKADNLILEMNRSKSISDFGVSTVDESTRKRQELQDLLKNSDWTIHGDSD